MPDLILTNANILTLDPKRPHARAVAVRGGRIAAIGEDAVMRAWAGPTTKTIDLGGRWLLPGIHDSHVHLGMHGLELGRLDLQDTPTLEAALAQVGARAAKLPEGSWILGSGFATSRWGVGTLTKEQLDKVAPHHPVLLDSQDHHSTWANSLAIRLAGIHAGTPDPANGRIVRNDRGEPEGLLLEHASELVDRVVPQPTDEELATAIRAGAEHLAGLGHTTVHHMAAEPAANYRQIALAASREDFPLRVWACIPHEDSEHAVALGLATGQGGERFMVGGAKFFADGALGSLTAWMLEPYAGSTETGVMVDGPEVLTQRLPMVIDAGLTPVIHAIGDAANHAVLDALASTAPQWRARGMRPRIEHAQHLHPDDVLRLAELGVVASMQADHLSFDARRIRELLPDRLDRAYALRSLLDAGALLAFGSDTPVARPDWRRGLLAATTRQGADGQPLCSEQGITPREAMAAYTRGAAYAIGREDRSGQIRAGYDADFTLVSDNPMEKPEGIEILGTMLAGRWTKQPDV
ncbi:MAG TPA: amidohydrolase [Trueperaceae bacterium]